MTDETQGDFVSNLPYVTLPRTPGGRVRMPQTWQAAIRDQVKGLGFQRKAFERFDGRKWRCSPSDARETDFATQYPDSVRAMLLALVTVAADVGEAEAAMHYSRLLIAFDKWRDVVNTDPFENLGIERVNVATAAEIAGVSRQAMLGLVKRGSVRAWRKGSIRGDYEVALQDAQDWRIHRAANPRGDSTRKTALQDFREHMGL